MTNQLTTHSTKIRYQLAADRGAMSLETAIVAAVLIVGAIAIAANLEGLYEAATGMIPDSLNG